MGMPRVGLRGEKGSQAQANARPQRQRRAGADRQAHSDRQPAGRLGFGDMRDQIDGHVGRHDFYSDPARFSGGVTLSTDEREEFV